MRLDFISLAVTVAVMALCAWILLAYVRPRRPAVRPHLKRLLMWACGAVLICWAASQFDHASNAPHAVAAGSLRALRTTNYAGDRHGMIACIDDCRTQLLNLKPAAAEAVGTRPAGWKFRVGFLEERKELAPELSGFEVVDVWDGQTDENLYHNDTNVHWVSVGLLLLSAALLAVTGMLFGRNPPEAAPETEAIDDGQVLKEEPRD